MRQEGKEVPKSPQQRKLPTPQIGQGRRELDESEPPKFMSQKERNLWHAKQARKNREAAQ